MPLTAPDPLLTAIRNRDLVTIERMLRDDPSLATTRATGGESLVLHACYVGAPELAPILRGQRGYDLWEAAALEDLDALRTAIGPDADAVARHGRDGWTPLHLAAFFGHADAVAFLVAHGAPLEVASTNAMANTPLHAAVAGAASPPTVRRLLEAGADPNALGARRVTPLHLAAARGDHALCALLLASGAIPQPGMDDGSTPAMLASARGHATLGEYLAALTKPNR